MRTVWDCSACAFPSNTGDNCDICETPRTVQPQQPVAPKRCMGLAWMEPASDEETEPVAVAPGPASEEAIDPEAVATAVGSDKQLDSKRDRRTASDNRTAIVVSDEGSSSEPESLYLSERKRRPMKRKRKSGQAAINPTPRASVIVLDDDDVLPAASNGHFSVPPVVPSAAAGGQFVCGICMCEETEGVVLNSCEHQYCLECMATYVASKVRDAACGTTQMICPSVDPEKCGSALTAAEVCC